MLGTASKLNRRLTARNRRFRTVAIVQNKSNQRFQAVNRRLGFEAAPYRQVVSIYSFLFVQLSFNITLATIMF